MSNLKMRLSFNSTGPCIIAILEKAAKKEEKGPLTICITLDMTTGKGLFAT